MCLYLTGLFSHIPTYGKLKKTQICNYWEYLKLHFAVETLIKYFVIKPWLLNLIVILHI